MSAWAFAFALLAAQEPGDPVRKIRELTEQGCYADAADAVRGLPEPARSREEAYVRYQAYDLEGAKSAASRALASEPGNASLLVLIGDVEASRGAIEGAAAQCRNARDARSRDPEVLRALAALERFVQDERDYRGRIRSRVQSAYAGTALWLALAAGIAAFTFRRALRGG